MGGAEPLWTRNCSSLKSRYSLPKCRFEMTLSNPATFTYSIVAFVSMGSMLSSLDQSLISGANLPVDLGLSSSDNSLVNAGMPLGKW
ncbi:hypothetical protein N7536_002528 [Penicillium majusculum]|nr:hypothetical protein N7536_002528 [Penicillium majusculum]